MTSIFWWSRMCTPHWWVSFIRTHQIGIEYENISREEKKKNNSYTNLTMFQGQTPIMWIFLFIGRVCVPYECVRRHTALMRCILDIGRLIYEYLIFLLFFFSCHFLFDWHGKKIRLGVKRWHCPGRIRKKKYEKIYKLFQFHFNFGVCLKKIHAIWLGIWGNSSER